MQLSTQVLRVPVIPKALEGRVEGSVSQRPMGDAALTQAQAHESRPLLACHKSHHLYSLLMSTNVERLFPCFRFSLPFILFGKI